MTFDPGRLAARLEGSADALGRCGVDALVAYAGARRGQRVVASAVVEVGDQVDARRWRCGELAATVDDARRRGGEAVADAAEAETAADVMRARCADALLDARSCLTTAGEAVADAERWEAAALTEVHGAERDLDLARADERAAASHVAMARGDVMDARSRLDAAKDADARRHARADLENARARLQEAEVEHEVAREAVRAATARLAAARAELGRARQRLANCRRAVRGAHEAVGSAERAVREADEARRAGRRAAEFAAGAVAAVNTSAAARADLEAGLATLADHVRRADERSAEALSMVRACESQHDDLAAAIADAGNTFCVKLDALRRLLAGGSGPDASLVSSNWGRVCEALQVGIDNPAIPADMKPALQAAALTISSRSLGIGLIDEATTRGQHHPILSKARLGAPGNNGPGYAYEVIATACLMRRPSVAINTGGALSIAPDARLGHGLVFWDEGLDGIPPRYAPGDRPRTLEADLGDARADGIVGVDFKYSAGGRYAASAYDLERRLTRVHALLSSGAIAEFHYVTNGTFAAGFRKAVDTANASLGEAGLRPIGLHEHVYENGP